MVYVIVLAIFAFVLLITAAKSIRIVRPYQRGLVERLGRYKETVQPGLRIIVPFLDRLILVDMREQVIDVPPQEVITQDNVVVSVDAVVYYEATDPQRLVYNVADFFTAILSKYPLQDVKYVDEYRDGAHADRFFAAIRRTAQGQEFRSNVHRGGRAEPIELDEPYREAAVRAALAESLTLATILVGGVVLVLLAAVAAKTL